MNDDDLPAPGAVADDLPEDLVALEQWEDWKPNDGRKIPRAPYRNPDWPDKFVDAQDPDVWTDVATAQEWAAKLPGYGLAFTIRDRDKFPDEFLVLVDYDNVRDPETGEIHPVVRDHIERAGSYAQVSTSGTGIHILCRGALPEGVKAVEADLPDHPNFPHAEIEVYDSARYIAMTGDRIEGTPRSTRPAQEFLDTVADTFATVAEGTPDAMRDEPDLAPEAVDNLETTSDFSAVCDAIQYVDPGDIRLRSTVTNERSDGSTSYDPCWTHSDSRTRLAAIGDGWVYRKGMHGLDALQVVALEERIITRPGEYPQGANFWTAVDALRDRGAHIPEYEPRPDPVAVLPRTREWCWRAASEQYERGSDDGPITIAEARDRTQERLEYMLEHTSGSETGAPDAYLLDALPTLGKSHGTIKAARETREPITVLTGRGRKEQYEQFREWCEAAGLTYKTLPAFKRDCDTATGEFGDNWADTVRDLYNRGATPQDIHKYAEDELGRPLPCQVQDGHDCPYGLKWDFDPDDHPDTGEPWDVLIGHYAHAHKEKVTKGRTVVVDEFPDAYETALDSVALPGAISYFLKCADGLPFDDYGDLLDHRNDDTRRREAIKWFIENGVNRDSLQAIRNDAGHAAAPIATYVLLDGPNDTLENGWERADLTPVDGRGVGIRDRAEDRIHLLTPPPLEYASGVVALDGTPTAEMWELALGLDLHHRQVLGPDERRAYLQDALELRFVRTTEWVKPYNSSDHVHVDEDAALLEAITDTHDRPADLITTATAEHEYDAAGIFDEHVGDRAHYGNVLGSNKFATSRVGAVIGSQHYGDPFIEKWGAYAGEAVARNDGKGADLSYGSFGDTILTHMREHETLQAAMRFGRDGKGATVYIHTDTLPEWVPINGDGRVLDTWSDGRKEVLEAAAGRDEWTTAELANDVSIGERQVRNHLHDLVCDGVVDAEHRGNGFVWRDGGLHRVSDHGEIDLDTVEPDDLDTEETAELARSSIYTWEFRSSTSRGGRDDQHDGAADGQVGSTPATGGEPPPDPPD